MTAAPVFVVGIGRSGTTLLRLMLTHHPRLAMRYVVAASRRLMARPAVA